eukprot:766462-Hanusia_phi.AAC.8
MQKQETTSGRCGRGQSKAAVDSANLQKLATSKGPKPEKSQRASTSLDFNNHRFRFGTSARLFLKLCSFETEHSSGAIYRRM